MMRISAHWRQLVAVVALATSSFAADDVFFDIQSESIPPNPNQNRVVLCLPQLDEQPPVLDGKIDDPIWRKAAEARDFFNTGTGLKDSEAMHSWVCRGPKALYVAMEIEYRVKNFPWPDMKPSDSLAVQVNPRHPDYAVYWLGTGVPGKKWKYVAPGFLPINHEVWQAAGRETDTKRYAELTIPYETFGGEAPAEGTAWGFNLIRSRTYRGPDKYKPRNFLGAFGYSRLTWAFINSSTWSSPEQFNFIFFGSEGDFKAKGLPSCVRLYMDRKTYFTTDPAAQGYLELDRGSKELAGATVELAVIEGDAELHKTTFRPEGEARAMSFHLSPTALEASAYRLRARAHDSGGVSFGEAYWEFGVEKKPPAPRELPQTIPLVVGEDPRIGNLDFPISTGVPLPEGLVEDTRSVRLLRDGKEIPCQTAVRSRWAPKGSVKWMGLDFVASYRDGKPQGKYALEAGVAPQAQPKPPLKCKEDENQITVETGPARFTISKKRFRLFERAEFDGNRDGQFSEDEVVLRAQEGDGPVFEDDKGNVYLGANDTECQVVVEESGPVKAVVHARGWYAGKRQRMCLYSVRMSFYAGLPAARVTHSWTATFDSDKVGVRNLALSHSLPGGITAYRLGNLHNAHLKPKEGLAVQPNESHYVLQSRWDQAIWVREPTGEIADWLGQTDYLPSLGVADVTTPNGRLIVSMRHFWQLFPKEIELRGNRLLYHIWPRHGRRALEGELDVRNIYKLWYAHQGEVLRFPLPKDYFERLKTWFEESGGF